jgi:hypothetical protein
MDQSEKERKALKEACQRKVAELWMKSIRDEFNTYGEVEQDGIVFYAERLKEILCVDEDPEIKVDANSVKITTQDMVITYKGGRITSGTR